MDRRQRIMVRDRCTCYVCGRVTMDGQADHKTPLHLGGADTDDNLAWICTEPCHKDKTARESGERARLTSV